MREVFHVEKHQSQSHSAELNPKRNPLKSEIPTISHPKWPQGPCAHRQWWAVARHLDRRGCGAAPGFGDLGGWTLVKGRGVTGAVYLWYTYHIPNYIKYVWTIYIHIYIYTYIHKYIHTYIHTYIICICIYMYMYMYMDLYMDLYMYMYMYVVMLK